MLNEYGNGKYLTLLKLGWTPAVNGLPDVLLCADDDGEDDEDDGGVEVVQPVYPVIIVAPFQPSIGGKTPKNTVKPVGIWRWWVVDRMEEIRDWDWDEVLGWVGLSWMGLW